MMRATLRKRAAAIAGVLAFVGFARAQTIILLDNFNAGTRSGAVIAGSSWAPAGVVTTAATTITVGAGAKYENGWGKSFPEGPYLDGSTITYVRVTAKLEPGNAAQSLVVQLEDSFLATSSAAAPTSAFSSTGFTHVLVPIEWDPFFSRGEIAGWSIGGGIPPGTSSPLDFRMTFDNLSLVSGLSLAGGGVFATIGNQVYSGAQSLDATTVLNTAGTVGNTVTFSSTINGANALTINTPGTTTLNGALGNTTPLASLTTDAGGTTAVNGGSVKTTGAQTYNDPVSLGANTLFQSISGGVITFIEALTGNNHTLEIDTDGDGSFKSATGLTAFTKSGAGTLTLTGTSTFTGTTTIRAGTLALGVNNALFSSSPFTAGGGTLALGGHTQTLGLLTITANSVFNFGGTGGTLTFANSSAQTWSGTLTITNYNTATNSLHFGSSGAGLTPTQLSLIRFADYGNATGQIDAFGLITPSAIPEPATYAVLAGLSAFGLAVLSRRKG
jgi:autotransporter-associated beta strand protein